MNTIKKLLSKIQKKWSTYKKAHFQKHFSLFTKILIVGFAVGIVLFISLFIYFGRDLPTSEELENAVFSESTKIYDRNETLLYEIFGNEKRTVVNIEDVSPYLIQATLAAEDDEFYKHPGFDIKALLRVNKCLIQQGIRKVLPFVPYCKISGGSTITQQYIKNTYIDRELVYNRTFANTLKRKFQEIILAVKVEKAYEKDKVLELYLNRITYGGTIYGIETASQIYFGIPAKDLSLRQSSILASIPNKPGRFSPFSENKEQLLERADWVLYRMKILGMITEEEEERALNTEVVYEKPKQEIKAPHFVLYAKDELKTLLETIYSKEKTKSFMETGGLSVITTLDYELQKIAEKIVKEHMEKAKENNYKAENASLVAQYPLTGEVITMVGSKDFFSEDIDGQVNTAISLRQPGSSIKPLIYTAAFNKGYNPATVVYDVPTNFGGGYSPNNYNNKFLGPITLRNALAKSLNIPAVKALYIAGIPESIDMGRKMGITTWEEDAEERCGLSLVLGGCETRLLDMVELYSVFANLGLKAEQHIFMKITDRDGNIIYEHKEQEPKEVLDPGVAYLTHSILSDNASRASAFGVSNKLNLPRENGAKTGTTNLYLDAWTIGYVPQLVAGVWAGNNQPSSMKHGGSVIAAPIWNEFMTKALERKELKKEIAFIKPDNVKSAEFSTFSGKLPSENTPAKYIKSDLYVVVGEGTRDEGEGTGEEEGISPLMQILEEEDPSLIQQVTICTSTGLLATEDCPNELKEILIFEKHIPIRDVPLWKDGINKWIESRKANQSEMPIEEREKTEEGTLITYVFSEDEIPTEFDPTFTIQNLEDAPRILWTNTPPETFEFGEYNLSFEVIGKSTIKTVKVMLDGKKIAEKEVNKLQDTIKLPLEFSLEEFKNNSSHTLTVFVYDSEKRQNFEKHKFMVKTDAFPPEITVLSPEKNQTISDKTIFLEAIVTDTHKIAKIEFYIDGMPVKTFNEESPSKTYTFTLENETFPEAGKHVFAIRAFDEFDNFEKKERELQIR